MSLKRLICAGFILLSANYTIAAESYNLTSERNTGTFRFEIDNDSIWDNDSNFSNGWSLQYHTKRYSSWEDSDAPSLYKWVGMNVPGLTDDESIVRYLHSIGQNMITPGDITNPNPPAGDLPYAGTLTYTAGWQSFNEEVGRNLQLSLGIMGDASLAENFQTIVHDDLGAGDTPEGWDSQRDTEIILNIGYQYNYRLAQFGSYDNGWGGQLEISPAASLGNITTSAELAIGLRFGWNIPKGFAVIAAPPVRGYQGAMEMVKPDTASPHSVEFYLGARGTALLYSVLYDGSFMTSDDRDVERDTFIGAGIFGITYRYYDTCAVRIVLQVTNDFLDEDSLPSPLPGEDKTATDNSYGAFIFEYYF